MKKIKKLKFWEIAYGAIGIALYKGISSIVAGNPAIVTVILTVIPLAVFAALLGGEYLVRKVVTALRARKEASYGE